VVYRHHVHPHEKGFPVSGRHHGLAFKKGAELAFIHQGCQFTSEAFTYVLKEHGIKISMDGRGRWIDNVFIERLWRSLKYEEIYLKAYDSTAQAKQGIGDCDELL